MASGRIATLLGRAARSALEPARRVAMHDRVTEPGYRLATAAGIAWGRVLGGDVERVGELHVVRGIPTWAYGRGGTTVGAAFLTNARLSAALLAHEDVHRQQWRRYGLWFVPMYYAAGIDATTNRFEIEAGLEAGGYVAKPARRARRGPTAS